MKSTHFDLLVIGAGPTGMSGALAASIFGKNVAVIERAAHVGGAGANTGTIPSKTLRESALIISGWRARKLLGLEVSLKREATLSEFTHHSAHVSATERLRLERQMNETRVRHIKGHARFIDPHTVSVNGPDGQVEAYSSETILVATGSSPVRPTGFSFEHPRIHDSDEILEIVELPKVLAVIGAGVIGSEYACTFAALGVEVHLVDGRDTLLPFLDTDVSLAISQGMEASGIIFHWGARVESCDSTSDDGILLTFTSGKTLKVTDVLVASGRKSNTAELNTEAAGIKVGERGLIVVDGNYRTNVPHIYAAGDVIGAPALAATGMEQSRVAISHAFEILPKETSSILPTGIYTIPEASMAGQTEQSLRESGIDYVVGRAAYADNVRGQITGDQKGFLKLLFSRDQMKLLGVHAVGEQATELVHIGLIALHCGASAELFSTVCFNYPTLGDLYKYASYDAMVKQLQIPKPKE